MAHRDPNQVLAIQDQLITAAHGAAPVARERVVNTTTLHPGYLVRDPSGTDLARYDRIELAQQAAALAGGGIYAWGRSGPARSAGTRSTSPCPPPGTPPHPAPPPGPPAAGAGIPAPRRAVAR